MHRCFNFADSHNKKVNMDTCTYMNTCACTKKETGRGKICFKKGISFNLIYLKLYSFNMLHAVKVKTMSLVLTSEEDMQTQPTSAVYDTTYTGFHIHPPASTHIAHSAAIACACSSSSSSEGTRRCAESPRATVSHSGNDRSLQL